MDVITWVPTPLAPLIAVVEVDFSSALMAGIAWVKEKHIEVVPEAEPLFAFLFPLPDTNECVVDNGGCSQVCSNTPPGSFSCGCRSGFTLASDGVSCTDVNECLTDANNCQDLCINTEGSFMCGCEPGYALGDDGVSCNGTTPLAR